MIRFRIGLEIRLLWMMRVCAIENKTATVFVASYRSVSRNPVRFKALILLMGLWGHDFSENVVNLTSEISSKCHFCHMKDFQTRSEKKAVLK